MRNIEVDKNINVGIISVFGELYSPAEIAELFKVAQSTIYNWIKTGKLEGHILSHGKRKTTVRCDKGQIQRFLDSRDGGQK